MAVAKDKLDFIESMADQAITELEGGRIFDLADVIKQISESLGPDDGPSVIAATFDEEGTNALLRYLRGRKDLAPQNIGPAAIWRA